MTTDASIKSNPDNLVSDGMHQDIILGLQVSTIATESYWKVKPDNLGTHDLKTRHYTPNKTQIIHK